MGSKGWGVQAIQDLAAIREALRIRRGGWATPWNWQVSHSWFTLRIEHRSFAGNLHLLCGDCERVEFERGMIVGDITVDESDGGFAIRDGTRLTVRCGLLLLQYNVLPVFGTGERAQMPVPLAPTLCAADSEAIK